MKALLQAHNISFSIASKDLPILFPTDLSIFPEEFVMILGHNGSGKSSLIKLLTGEIASGSVLIDNILLTNLSLSEKAKSILTLTQKADERLFAGLSLYENILLWESRFAQHLQLEPEVILELTGRKDKFMKCLNQPAMTLSGGEKQSLLLALALAHPPRILFLDEHTSSLDPSAAEKIMLQTATAIKNHKITAVMVTHSLEDAIKYGNRIIILKEGKIISDAKKHPNLSITELKKIME